MKEIILVEDCFGSDVLVDGESLFVHEYDNRDPKIIDDLKVKLLTKMLDLRNDINITDWYKIGEIICNLSDDFEYDDELSTYGTCEQCNNYNWRYIYGKK